MFSTVRGYIRAHHVALIALFVALGGTSYAAIRLPANSVGTKQLKKNAVTLKKIKPGARKALRGRRGATGPPGTNGQPGPPGPGAVRIDFTRPRDPDTTETLFSREGLSIAATCSKDTLFGDTKLALNLTASGANATVNVSWIKQFHVDGTPTPYQSATANGTVPIPLQGHSGFDRAEGQAVLRTDGLTVSFTFHALASGSGGPCEVSGTATPAT
jgi:hypothetical protein